MRKRGKVGRRLLLATLAAVSGTAGLAPANASGAPAERGVDGELRVSADGRCLTYADGAPFFWLGDTAWGVFGRLSRADITHYLQTRKNQGFTVIQMVTVFPVYRRANSEGVDIGDLSAPNPKYFELVDHAVREARRLGLYTALWPVWSRDQHAVIDAGKARAYGEFLGRRYRDEPIIWVFGGDDPDERPEVWRNLARGIAVGKTGREDYSGMLMSYHPVGQSTSAAFHDEPWLDFNMTQSGHDSTQRKPYELIAPLYARTPTKPVVESEAMYEKHSDGWDDPDDIADARLTRNYIYWSILSGGMGHAYGHWYIWPFVDAAHPHPYSKIAKLRGDWKSDYLRDEVAGQVRHMKALMLSRGWCSGAPDASLVRNAGAGRARIQALRGRDGSYMIAYTPDGRTMEVDTTRLSGAALKGWWFDPRAGEATALGAIPRADAVPLQPPAGGDWVLVVDDAARNYPPPGR